MHSLTQTEIESGLRSLGVRSGEILEVHSSLSSLGHVQGGAMTVVGALMSVVGQHGGLMMSAYPVSMPVSLTAGERTRGIEWKVRVLLPDSTEKTGMGAVADEFRLRRDVVLGQGLHRVAAWGSHASELSSGYEQLVAMDGRVLLIGVKMDRCSSLHVVESTCDLPGEIRDQTVVPDDLLRDYPEDSWRVGFGPCPDFNRVGHIAESRGLILHGCIGEAECQLFHARSLVEVYGELLRTQPYWLCGLRPICEMVARDAAKDA